MRNKKYLRETQYFWAFFWAAFIFGFLLFGSVTAASLPAMRHDYDSEFYQTIVDDFTVAEKETDVSLVMLGNSRLRGATTIGYDVRPAVTLPDGRDMTAVQFAVNSARFYDYRKILEPLLATHPDLIIVQDTLIANALAAQPDVGATTRVMYLHFTKMITGKTIPEIISGERHESVPCRDDQFDREAMDEYLEFLELFRRGLEDDNPSYTIAQDFIAKAVAQGSKVIVIRIDPNIPFFRKLDVPIHLSEYPGLGYMPTIAQLLPQTHKDVEFRHYGKVKGDVYCDMIHFNAKGADLFTDWLLREIMKITKQTAE